MNLCQSSPQHWGIKTYIGKRKKGTEHTKREHKTTRRLKANGSQEFQARASEAEKRLRSHMRAQS